MPVRSSSTPRRRRRSSDRSRGGSADLTARDFLDHVIRRAAIVAPRDVEELVARAGPIRRRIGAEAAGRPTFVGQVELALDLLADHVGGRIPHVPYRTVTLLAAALHYYLEPIDVIPDFVGDIGMVDDRLVMAFAFAEGADGLRRYRAWREIAAPAARRRPARSRRS